MTRYQFNCTSSYLEAWNHCMTMGYAFDCWPGLKVIEIDESQEDYSDWTKYRLEEILEEDVRMLDM